MSECVPECPVALVARPSSAWVRALALMAAVAVALVCALAPVAIAHELDHDCTGQGCAVCAELVANLHLSQENIPSPTGPCVPAVCEASAASDVVACACAFCLPPTLVNLMVQLND